MKYIFIFILNLFLIYNYRNLKKIYSVYDIPDSIRKIHKVSVPLLGGLIIYINFLFIYLLGLNDYSIFEIVFFQDLYKFNLFFIISTAFFILGYLDDKKNISPNIKLLTMIILILITLYLDDNSYIKELRFSFYSKTINLEFLGFWFSLLCFLLFINSFNMLDGINGQASIYSLFIFIVIIFNYELNIFIFIFLNSIIFFLYLNFRNRAFLGDSGTLLLGYMISYFFIKLYNNNYFHYSDEIFLIMSVPGYDLLRLAITRILNKKHPFSSDSNHLHHIILKKTTFFKTLCIVQILLLLPYLIFILSSNFIISLILSLLLYIITIYVYFQKN